MRILFLLTLLMLSGSDLYPSPAETLRRLPVQHGGRVKPLDTVARASLLLLHGSQSLNHEGRKLPPSQWLLEVMLDPKVAKSVKLIRVDNRDLQSMLGGELKNRVYYSMVELEPFSKELFEQYSQALGVDENQRDSFQRASIVLWEQIATFLSLSNTLWISGIDNVPQELNAFEQEMTKQGMLTAGDTTQRLDWFKQRYQFLAEAAYFHVLHTQSNQAWLNMGEGLLAHTRGEPLHPDIKFFTRMISAYQQENAKAFNTEMSNYLADFQSSSPAISRKIDFEILYNDLQPFFVSAIIYVLVILCSVFSWMVWPKALETTALILLSIGFVIHSGGLLARMFIEGRPPVTNLFSSVIFVGWGAVALSFVLERVLKHCMGCVVGAVIGALSMVVALHMVGSGDTMEAMRAVLDSNFWLSTHVVTITLGYSSTFLAGGLAALFILRGVFTTGLNKETSAKLGRMVYGIICFSTLLTFIGTVLGGIWADQSWGRFWGWDPKENGALMIILWNATILHAKAGGFVRERGMMVMAVCGNIVTSLSWFGVNMLGTGLHSYGFMAGGGLPLTIFCISQLMIMCLGRTPKHIWKSFKPSS